MTIKEEKPLTVSEVINLIGDSEKTEEIKKFLKTFNDMNVEKALELKEKLSSLKILKLDENDIVKIIDFMPEDAVELNKVISDSNLDSEEITKVLNVINN